MTGPTLLLTGDSLQELIIHSRVEALPALHVIDNYGRRLIGRNPLVTVSGEGGEE